MTEHWYTFQIILHRKEPNSEDLETHEFRDCTPEKIELLRMNVWTNGVKINHTPNSWEVICPFSIKQVFIVKQDKKFGV